MTKVTIDLDYEISHAFGIIDDIGVNNFTGCWGNIDRYADDVWIV